MHKTKQNSIALFAAIIGYRTTLESYRKRISDWGPSPTRNTPRSLSRGCSLLYHPDSTRAFWCRLFSVRGSCDSYLARFAARIAHASCWHLCDCREIADYARILTSALPLLVCMASDPPPSCWRLWYCTANCPISAGDTSGAISAEHQ